MVEVDASPNCSFRLRLFWVGCSWEKCIHLLYQSVWHWMLPGHLHLRECLYDLESDLKWLWSPRNGYVWFWIEFLLLRWIFLLEVCLGLGLQKVSRCKCLLYEEWSGHVIQHFQWQRALSLGWNSHRIISRLLREWSSGWWYRSDRCLCQRIHQWKLEVSFHFWFYLCQKQLYLGWIGHSDFYFFGSLRIFVWKEVGAREDWDYT